MPTDTPAPSSKYRLIRPLGEGGMGAVYLARDTALNREVALKFVAADMLSDADARKRLVREAQAAAALDHPAICAVYDIELRPDGEACIVMPYIEGETLAVRLERGPLELREALTLVAELADALAAAHKRGVIHRDIKPQNVMVTPSGRAKLLDFGIATLTDAIAVSSAEAATTAATRPLLAGTPPYMSPEQLTQRPLDGRSDLFSLGCVLYECLTGRPAFQGRNALEISGQVLHVHPPAPSSLRSELTPEHDELCRRLMAKAPADRFQSADELLGALRVLLPDTARAETRDEAQVSRAWQWTALVIVAVAGISAFGWWYSTRPIRLPEPPPEASKWFERGTNSIREGAYYAAKLALKQALAIFPDYPQAHTRLAEALIELDEGEGARDALLQANRLAAPERLPPADRARNEAIQAMLLRDPDSAAKAYRRLIELEPRDPGAWIDLARVQEIAGLWSDARQSLGSALRLDQHYAAAHLRLGALEAQEGRRAEALAAFAEAERLYRAASDGEGETEALLLRGAFLDSLGEFKDARAALERAKTLASTTSNTFQSLRAELRLSSVTAAEGHYEESQKQADQAIRAARAAGLDTIAADGLVELGATLMQARRMESAESHLKEALAIAEREKAEGIALRAILNLASLRQAQGHPSEALSLAENALGRLQARRERRKVLSALAIMTRAHRDLEQYARAKEMAQQLLTAAQDIGDEVHVAHAYEALANHATLFGELPVALDYLTRVEDIHRRQAENSSLPFDLTNRAELLIRMGRADHAAPLLHEVEEGAARGVDAYVSRRRRVLLLHALSAITAHEFNAARQAAGPLRAAGSAQDATAQLADALVTLADVRLERRRFERVVFAEPNAGTLAAQHEVRYWQLVTLLQARDFRATFDGATAALKQLTGVPSPELEWRLAAIGAAAASRLGDRTEADRLRTRATEARSQLRAAWGEHLKAYEHRGDLAELRKLAGL
ncbi:MAG: protein kinase [Vicinamibacterales bacterium]